MVDFYAETQERETQLRASAGDRREVAGKKQKPGKAHPATWCIIYNNRKSPGKGSLQIPALKSAAPQAPAASSFAPISCVALLTRPV